MAQARRSGIWVICARILPFSSTTQSIGGTIIFLPCRVLTTGYPLNSSKFTTMPSVPFTNLSFGLFLVHITTAPALSSRFSGQTAFLEGQNNGGVALPCHLERLCF